MTVTESEMIKQWFCDHQWVEDGLPSIVQIKTMGPTDRVWECIKCHKVIVKPFGWLPIQEVK